MPQLIVAYDGLDQFANLIHITKAQKAKDYYCPCCGGVVRYRGGDQVQPHYYHLTSECSGESQLHFFCKNWLFEKGSAFYIGEDYYEVADIDIEHTYDTKFGKYRPDISVKTTDGFTILFELFFTNNKRQNDYFAKWQDLNYPVVEVKLKEYLYKEGSEDIPHFTYLYNDGECFCKEYVKRDVYADTIGRLKHSYTREQMIAEKLNLEALDNFWIYIQSNHLNLFY